MAVGWLALAASTAVTWHAFASVWATDRALFYARDGGLLAVTQALKQELVPGSDPVVTYLSPAGWDHPTVQYGLVDADPPVVLLGFDGRVCVRVPDGPARYIVLTGEDFRGLALLRTYLPDSSEHTLAVDPDGEPLAVELTQPEGGRAIYPEMTPYPMAVADGISLDGYWLSAPELQPGERLYVRLQWRAATTPKGKYTAFAHLLAVGADAATQQLAGADAEPGKGTCPTDRWLPGETVVDEMEFIVPEQLDTGAEYWVAVGLYTLADGRRLTVSGSADNQILIGPLTAATAE